MKEKKPTLELHPEETPGATSVRLTVLAEDSAHPLLDSTEDDWLTAVPHLILREITVFCLFVAVVAMISYAFDAPLLDLANPSRTPNPAKAPWYFLGIQELLHYYPPFISGILMPGLAILALLVIPYFDINVERPPFLSTVRFWSHLGAVWIVGLAANTAFLLTSHAGPVWPLFGVTTFLLVMMTLPALLGRSKRVGAFIATRSLPFWIFTWFVLSWVVLTIIGVFFRGPGWSFTLPWVEGIYD